MEIKELAELLEQPGLYEPGNAFMWTDPHIAKQLLEVHLSNQTDLASRKKETIRKTVDWILSQFENEKLNILDLGCGPGLYSEQLALKGHRVTGVDISSNSIAYAKSQARLKNLDIQYFCQDYTNLGLSENQYDLVMLIYTDICPLTPDQRKDLLNAIKKVLRPDGVFIFDFTNDSNLEEKATPRNWELSNKGFWKNEPYLALSNSFTYEKEKVVLYQHLVVCDDEKMDLYRFWHHYFSDSDIRNILEKHGFGEITFHQQVIPGGDEYQSEDISFCIAKNMANH